MEHKSYSEGIAVPWWSRTGLRIEGSWVRTPRRALCCICSKAHLLPNTVKYIGSGAS